jgi:hypothetical protein
MLTCLGSMPGGHEAFGSRSPVTTGLNTYRGSQTTTERGNRCDQRIVSKEVSEIREGVGIILAAFVKDPTDQQWQETTKYHEWLAFMRKNNSSASVTDVQPYWLSLHAADATAGHHNFDKPTGLAPVTRTTGEVRRQGVRASPCALITRARLHAVAGHLGSSG